MSKPMLKKFTSLYKTGKLLNSKYSGLKLAFCLKRADLKN